MKKALFIFRIGEPNPTYLTQLTEKDEATSIISLLLTQLENAWFEIMDCKEEQGDLDHEIFWSSMTCKEYKHKTGMIFQPI